MASRARWKPLIKDCLGLISKDQQGSAWPCVIVLSMELLARSAGPKEGRYASSIDAQPFSRMVADLLWPHIGHHQCHVHHVHHDHDHDHDHVTMSWPHIGDACLVHQCLVGQLTTQRGGISPISLEVLGKWAGN